MRAMAMRRCGVADRAGSIAVEFALIAPILILLGLGVFQIAAAIRVQLAVNQSARSVANLIVQQSDVTTAELNDIFKAGKDSYSFNAGTVAISAASVRYSSTAPTVVEDWDAASVATSYVASPGNVTTLAANLGSGSGNDSVVVVQASSTFSVPAPFGPLPLSFTIKSTAFARPRLGYFVKLN